MFSIITISLNNVNGLRKTVESVLSQSGFDSVEYIIVDGNSNDGTKEYLLTLPKKIKWISEKDSGISCAFNKGLKIASGDAVLFLNSGDTFCNEKSIETATKDWIASKTDILSYKVLVKEGLFIPMSDNQKSIWEKCELPHQGTFVSRNVYTQIGGYSEEYRIRMDYHFFARCRKAGFSFRYIPQIIANYEPGGVSMSEKNRMRFWREGMAVKMLYDLSFEAKDSMKFLLYH